MKENILFIVLLMIGIGAGYFTGLKIGRDEIEKKYQEAPVRRTVTETTEKIPQQKRSATIENLAPVSREHRIDADSVFDAGMRYGIDSVRSEFANRTAPVDTSITFDSVGTVHVTYRPLLPGRPLKVTLDPAPTKIITVTVTDSIFVKIPEEREWWKTPAYILGSLAVGWVAHDVLRKD